MAASIASARNRPLANRLLFPSLPQNANLPPLIGSPELSAELYDTVALALRAFVVPWWSKISRYDKQLLPEITRIIAQVIHALDARISAVNLAPLLLVHAPAIITQHYRDYRNAHRKLHTSYAAGGAASLPQLFHQLQPHMAVSADGRLDTEYFRHLVDHILKACLPEEDYQPEAERFIVREIILKVLLNDVIPKITQPWFAQRAILDLLQLQTQASIALHLFYSPTYTSPQLPPLQHRPPSPPSSSSSFHTIIVLVLSAIQAISTACLALIHAYKQTLNTLKRLHTRHPPSPRLPSPHNYAHAPLMMLAEIFTLPSRTASTTLLTSTRLIADFSSSFLDRLLPHLLEAQLSPAFILTTTRTAKRTLFPNGYPGPPVIEPSPDEQAETRARLVGWRPRGALASRLLPLLLGPDPTTALDAALDPLGSAPCNVHLVLFLLDLVLLELFPELAPAPEGGGGGGGSESGNGSRAASVGRDADSGSGSEGS